MAEEGSIVMRGVYFPYSNNTLYIFTISSKSNNFTMNITSLEETDIENKKDLTKLSSFLNNKFIVGNVYYKIKTLSLQIGKNVLDALNKEKSSIYNGITHNPIPFTSSINFPGVFLVKESHPERWENTGTAAKITTIPKSHIALTGPRVANAKSIKRKSNIRPGHLFGGSKRRHSRKHKKTHRKRR